CRAAEVTAVAASGFQKDAVTMN
ncbi:hypothetical protein Tco_0685307, partial [Tanacetum coccineum]